MRKRDARSSSPIPVACAQHQRTRAICKLVSPATDTAEVTIVHCLRKSAATDAQGFIRERGTRLDSAVVPTQGLASQGKIMKRALITVVALGLAMGSFGVCLAGMF